VQGFNPKPSPERVREDVRRQECRLPLWCVLPCLPGSYWTCLCVHSHTTFALSLCAKCCLHLLLLRLGGLRSPATSWTYCLHACCCYYQLLVAALYAFGIFAATGFHSDGRCACGARCQCLLRVCFIFRSTYAMCGVQRCFTFRLAYAGVGAWLTRGSVHGRDLGGRRDQRA
jgi:hypothetical protein